MLGKLFSKFSGGKAEWDVSIKNGDMLRKCRRTGVVEYRDTGQKKWIPVKDRNELDDIREQQWVTPAGYSPDD
jgi:hypothetical protein